MSGYDFDRPFIDQAQLRYYTVADSVTTARYGKRVKAIQLSNSADAAFILRGRG